MDPVLGVENIEQLAPWATAMFVNFGIPAAKAVCDKLTDKAAEAVVNPLCETAKSAWDWLAAKVSGHAPSAMAIKAVKDQPNDADAQAGLALLLKGHLLAGDEIGVELKKRLTALGELQAKLPPNIFGDNATQINMTQINVGDNGRPVQFGPGSSGNVVY